MPARISLKPSDKPAVRNATRLLTMVHELHKAGYQRIRISPGLAPSGLYWRCAIAAAGLMDESGWRIRSEAASTAYQDGTITDYTTGNENEYFGWTDSRHKSGRELAALFLDRFPVLARQGDGRDWVYAGWLTEWLGRAEHGELPVFRADYELTFADGDLPPPPPA